MSLADMKERLPTIKAAFEEELNDPSPTCTIEELEGDLENSASAVETLRFWDGRRGSEPRS